VSVKARIVFDPPSDRHLIYIWSEADGRRVARYRDAATGAAMMMTVPDGADLPVWGTWSSAEHDALAAALLDSNAPPNDLDDAFVAEISGALDDARMVRDRLLTLVERIAE
jgi:hypothetical protein